ncbi:MAG: OsmC family protein [Chitinophagaceae bacterium]|nr:OsmC family protein [Chitinophagaceae bacterium]MCW5929639.1 OsmC family protein [Chitinophagaceae bacterium]
MSKLHSYQTHLTWKGNLGSGTSFYNSYKRDYAINAPGKPPIEGSSDPEFRGDGSRYNPEELLVAALSSCHMLWFLHLCAVSNIIVTAYEDNATGTMNENADGSGSFSEVVLHPVIYISGEINAAQLDSLHKEANQKCFIASSCNFPVRHMAEYKPS